MALTEEDKLTIKEAVLQALIAYEQLNVDRDRFLTQRVPLKDLISSFRTPKPKVDESNPH